MNPLSPEFVSKFLEIAAALFVTVVGLGALALIVIYVIDRLQKKHAVRRNYPIIGRMRYVLEELGVFFRQYFFAMDREEMPFNREQRSWVYRAAKNVGNTIGFGSTRDLRANGTILFVNCAFPTLEEEAQISPEVIIGPDAEKPYRTASFFNISAMSFGAISKVAVEALSKGAAMGGVWLNTGEGGLSQYHLMGGCDIVFQIGTAKYGVRDRKGLLSDDRLRALAAHDQVRMFEIKLSQGAKPGKGGLLPGKKVTDEVAAIRGIPAGQDSLSPNRHPEINDPAGLLDMIERIRRVTGRPAGFKAVIGSYGWLIELFDEIGRRGIESAPDFITVDSADGGSGAAPMTLMDYMGLPIQESLPLVVDLLEHFGLHERIRVIASGKLLTAGDVAWALCTGADFVNCARGFMFSLGCIQAMQCHLDTCPTGVTTHNPSLQKGLVPNVKAVRVANYARNMAREVATIAHSCGVAEPRALRRHHAQMVIGSGRTKPLDVLYREHSRDMLAWADEKSRTASPVVMPQQQ